MPITIRDAEMLSGISIWQLLIISFLTIIPCALVFAFRSASGEQKAIGVLLAFLFSWLGLLAFWAITLLANRSRRQQRTDADASEQGHPQ